uniref:LAGLIDADG homing endonuclease n=1 Tax=Rhizoctonia solani TaxID=456999 RepID=A0A8E8L8N2_9AGAM|nr:LAGLIDADG homing endonuclease [Rhizoctonia solani]
MLLACFIKYVLAIALPSLRISPLFRIALTFVLFYAAVLSFNAVYIQSIGSGIGILSPLFTSSLIPVKPDEDSTPSGTSNGLTKEEKAALTVPNQLREILVGLLLGDLYAQKQNVNTRFHFKQGVIHKDYLMHLYELFKDFCFNAPKIFDLLADKRTAKVYSSMRFTTYTLPCFNELYELFHVDGKKVIPLNIGELLTPLGLCYWICDDGGFCKRDRALVLSTQSFTLVEVKLLAEVLTNKFGLKCAINKNNGAFIIRISAKSIPAIQTMLKDIMPPMMLYKIGL